MYIQNKYVLYISKLMSCFLSIVRKLWRDNDHMWRDNDHIKYLNLKCWRFFQFLCIFYFINFFFQWWQSHKFLTSQIFVSHLGFAWVNKTQTLIWEFTQLTSFKQFQYLHKIFLNLFLITFINNLFCKSIWFKSCLTCDVPIPCDAMQFTGKHDKIFTANFVKGKTWKKTLKSSSALAVIKLHPEYPIYWIWWSWMDVFFKYEYETCTQTFFDCKNSPGLVTIILFSTSFVLIHVLNNGQSEHFIQYEYSILIERRGPGGSVS